MLAVVMNEDDAHAPETIEQREVVYLVAAERGAGRAVTDSAPATARAAVEIARDTYGIRFEQARPRVEAHHTHQTRRIYTVAAVAVLACVAIACRPDAGQWIVPIVTAVVGLCAGANHVRERNGKP